MTSERCFEGTYWDHTCIPCEKKYKVHAGYEFSANCGWSDEQQQVDQIYRECRDGTFNNGSYIKCKRCRSCHTPEFVNCSTEADSICCRIGEQVVNGECILQQLQTTKPTTLDATLYTTASDANSQKTTELSEHFFRSSPASSTINLTGIYVCLGILSALSLMCLFFVLKRRRTRHFNEESPKCRNGAVQQSQSKKGFERFQDGVTYNIIKETANIDEINAPTHLLAPGVKNAPLKAVLNNLDILEELKLVLDPETTGAKCTRHLASQCSFSFSWINYAYSMKDHKSPLIAVLEGVVTKNPDWTVGHLADKLNIIGRNDAVEILAKLPADIQEELL